ncbi:MAG: type II toxin-antitoxin system HicB family antitoxin [Gammaproteobacteria bacterium]|jgi:predicted RNase H-like HicB family nuclease|nr:type II toxin-antitoxin system HicB family antitoxin [Gammaproteobacteria bacterium]MBU1408978.1 type II toxin-antitoxin system HicB family antitoxin [Gammaproteobacteria bacterium]MBU1533601.1 type II toxin-antitoxin system HicB family antitoxin [Gammaproteobacteria bacterium]
MRFAIVVEKTENNYSAYVPDLPGCVATGQTVEEVENEIRSAIEFHIEGLREDGQAIPQPVSIVEYLEVAA